MSDVPLEIITSILIRLPVKSLLRARCVSKPWRCLIDGQDFIKQHLRHSAETNSNRTLLVESSSYNILSIEKTKLSYLDLDSLERLDTGDLRSKPQHLVGSCDGLVLFLTFSHDIVLWNPSTRKLKQLPAPPPPPPSADYSFVCPGVFRYGLFGLGYDSKHDDYKVVWVDWCSGSRLETKIYSLKTDSWKNVGDFRYSLVHEKPRGVYLNDALHTVVKEDTDLALVAINLANEELYEFPKPDFGGVSHTLSSVEVIGGCLALVVVPGEWNQFGALWVINSDVWVMKEYGVKDSWCKLFSFHHSVPGEYLSLLPLGYSKSGDEVLLNDDGKRLVWFDFGEKRARDVCVEGLSVLGDVWACVESLVSLGSEAIAAGVEINKQNAPQGKIKKKSDDFLSAGFKLRL